MSKRRPTGGIEVPLLPDIAEINRRLTIIAREQQRLRKLLSIAVEARQDAEEFGRIRVEAKP